MPPAIPGSADASNKFEDLSGVDSAAFSNPYDAMIEACQDDAKHIQSRYSAHRTTRNAQQKAKLLSLDCKGLILDPILQKLEDPGLEPGFVDPRNCLVIWARPPPPIRILVDQIQQKLKKPAPNLWLMPVDRLHMTALEVTHSLTAPEITAIVSEISPVIQTMTDYPFTHRARLIKPLLSYDGAAVALSFLPAAGEGLTLKPPSSNSSETVRSLSDDNFTYHHLRRDLYSLTLLTGVAIESRYVVPSAHITVGRFLVQSDHNTPAKMQAWIHEIEEINSWLEKEFWPKGEEQKIKDGGEWIVGQGKGLDLRKGRLWYGGGETVRLGRGF